MEGCNFGAGSSFGICRVLRYWKYSPFSWAGNFGAWHRHSYRPKLHAKPAVWSFLLPWEDACGHTHVRTVGSCVLSYCKITEPEQASFLLGHCVPLIDMAHCTHTNHKPTSLSSLTVSTFIWEQRLLGVSQQTCIFRFQVLGALSPSSELHKQLFFTEPKGVFQPSSIDVQEWIVLWPKRWVFQSPRLWILRKATICVSTLFKQLDQVLGVECFRFWKWKTITFWNCTEWWL